MRPGIPQQQNDAGDDSHIGDVKNGPHAKIEKIRDGAVEKTVDGIPESTTEQQSEPVLHTALPRYFAPEQHIQTDENGGNSQKKPLLILQNTESGPSVQYIRNMKNSRNDRYRFVKNHDLPYQKLASLIEKNNQQGDADNLHKSLLKKVSVQTV